MALPPSHPELIDKSLLFSYSCGQYMEYDPQSVADMEELARKDRELALYNLKLAVSARRKGLTEAFEAANEQAITLTTEAQDYENLADELAGFRPDEPLADRHRQRVWGGVA